MTPSFDFYFDFASPFGFLASRRVSALAKAIGRDINWRPFLIGAVYKEYGGAPLDNPLKKDYTFRDFFRRARFDGIDEVRIPANFPASSVPPSRLAYWVEREAPERMGAFVEAAYRAYWIEGKDTADANAALNAAAGLGFDRNAAAAGAQQQDIKDKLRFETENALARGVFGSPFILIDDEPFWGSDRFEDIERLYDY
ncbi:MAG: 2-hydroxychromene-2-carboxylate isomerase [Rhodanobacter sp.]|nr:MAG: 2-hydroxychromene-2-carboxylate isomerase [Rhodanobacter sp.]TAM38654.1 MAG: 2-hydroxychromene-2-carboxylate isomerase [Rhodanobacter sp.]TAN23679.1 MAG: 2-hydroxychromene-2-carboxylate isomerase [Rhodanobacter sp.]